MIIPAIVISLIEDYCVTGAAIVALQGNKVTSPILPEPITNVLRCAAKEVGRMGQKRGCFCPMYLIYKGVIKKYPYFLGR